MKYTVVLTLVISLVLVGFGGFLVEAQGVNNEVRPGNIEQINPKRITYQQIYKGNLDLIEIDKQQSAEIGILLNEYFNKRNQLISNIDYNRDELRKTILTNGALETESVFNEKIVELNEKLMNLRNEYLGKMRAVLTEEQVNKISESNYIVNISNSAINNYQTARSVNRYPIQGMANNNRFSSNTDITSGLQCGINYLQRGY
ncbi:MAG TPA: hypothetical protein VKN64_10110 [Halanaerobiales bacterium]|nr:hypothetical protein [Halanaerobiales bacterium]